MNSNQRVAKVFAGEVPDRVPIGEFAIDFDTIETIIGRPTYLRAKAKSKVAFWENRHDEVIESYTKDHIELHEKLGFDIINFPMATWAIPAPTDVPPPKKLNANTWEDREGRVFKYSEITYDVVCVKDPIAEKTLYTMDHEVLAEVEDELQEEASECDQAKQRLINAETAEQGDVARQVVEILCND